MNRAIVMGRLGNDPETKSMANGTTLVTFALATNERWRKDGEHKERVDWHRCEAWGSTGDVIAKHCRKGDRVLIEGRIRVDSVERGGERKTYTKILVDRFEFAFSQGGKGSDREDMVGADQGGDLSDLPF